MYFPVTEVFLSTRYGRFSFTLHCGLKTYLVPANVMYLICVNCWLTSMICLFWHNPCFQLCIHSSCCQIYWHFRPKLICQKPPVKYFMLAGWPKYMKWVIHLDKVRSWLFALIINCTIIMKTNSRFSRNVYAISDRILCNKHPRHTTTEKYDTNGKGGYSRFDYDNNMSYRYILSITYTEMG